MQTASPGRRPVGTGAVLASGSQVVTAAAGAAMGIVVARVLGPADTGSFSVLVVALQLLLAGTMLGLQAGITYFVSSGRWDPAEAYRQAQLAALTLGLSGAGVGFALALLAGDDLFPGVDLWLVALAFGALPFALSWLFGSHVALGSSDYETFAAAPPIQNVSALVLVAGLTPFFGLTGAVLGLALSHAVSALRMAVWGLRRSVASSTRWLRGALSRLARAGRFGLAAWVPQALQYVNNRADLLVLSLAASKATVGRYAIALAVVEIGLLLPRALTSIVFPRVAELEAESDERTMVIEKSVRHAVLMVPPTALLLVAAIFAIPLVYGSGFAAATGMALVLVPGVLALGLANVLGATVMGRGHPRYLLYSSLVVTPPTLVLYAVLIPAFEGYGAAVASTVSYTALAIAYAFYFRRVTGATRLRPFLPDRSELADYRQLWARVRARRAGRAG